MKNLAVGRTLRILSFILILFTLLAPIKTYAATDSGTVGLTGRVATAPPNAAPVILLPIDQVHSSDSTIVVSGTCRNDLLINIYVNDIFSGAAVCLSGAFSIEIDLYSGANKIIARGFDSLDQSTPDSNAITVFLDIELSNLRLTSNNARLSVDPGEELSWPLIVSGGKSPYAVLIDWGDSNTSLKSVLIPGEFTLEHEYKYSGIYNIVVRGVDIDGGNAILHLVAVVNGIIITPASDKLSNEKTTVLWWPMASFFVFTLFAFWLGRKYERRLNQ